MTNENETKVDTHACPHGRGVDEYCAECAPPAPPKEDASSRAFDVAAWDEMVWG